MKKINKLIIGIFTLILMVSCYDGIDPISEVDAGPDQGAPIVTIIKPTDGLAISEPNPISSVDIEIRVEDDIEVGSISVMLDGNEIASYEPGTYVDYRIVTREMTYDNITIGDHTLTVTATDLVGNVTTSTSNFTKEPPYSPLYEGEILYMPFDGDYTNLVTSTAATEVGNPGFAGQAKVGNNAYAGATDSYLTYPTEGLLGSQFTATFWYKVNASPDRAGILVIGPPDTANPNAQNNRTSGFRLFRENAGGKQRIKLNVGNGTGENWFDGGAAADVDPAVDQWVHLAFTISESQAAVYINGEVVSQNTFPGISWADCDLLSIMSGAPRFTGWDHKSDLSYMDELRLFNVTLSQSEIQQQMIYGNQTMYLPFNGSYSDALSDVEATEFGSPGFTGSGNGYDGNAYEGALDSYLTVPTDALNLGTEFSASFWYKLNASPDRAGILVIGPPDTANPDAQNNRTAGFRFFRENAGGKQRFKLNVGTGSGESWFDGGAAADLDPAVATGWVHLAFTISATQGTVYINGQVVSQNTFSGVSWENCDIMSIMSGAPRFIGWDHESDLSSMDDLRLFDKALSQSEIQSLMF